MPFADGYLIDRDQLQMIQVRPGKSNREVCPLDLFDCIPADPQVSGNIEDGYMFRQFNDIPLKITSMGAPSVGKAKFDLAYDTARSTKDSWDPEFEIHLFSPDRQGMEPSKDASLAYDLNAFATGASQRSWFLLNTENKGALLIFSSGVAITVNAESMV